MPGFRTAARFGTAFSEHLRARRSRPHSRRKRLRPSRQRAAAIAPTTPPAPRDVHVPGRSPLGQGAGRLSRRMPARPGSRTDGTPPIPGPLPPRPASGPPAPHQGCACALRPLTRRGPSQRRRSARKPEPDPTNRETPRRAEAPCPAARRRNVGPVLRTMGRPSASTRPADAEIAATRLDLPALRARPASGLPGRPLPAEAHDACRFTYGPSRCIAPRSPHMKSRRQLRCGDRAWSVRSRHPAGRPAQVLDSR